MDGTNEPIKIDDKEAIRWYNFGFLFALNYVYKRLPDANAGMELNKGNFKEFVNNRFTLESGDPVVDDKFFVDHPFKQTNDPNGPYGPNGCPGDIPNTCIPCTANGIDALP